MVLIGLIGKPNVGKSTFFSALTNLPVKIASYPFTTIEPNKGIAYVRIKCVCKEFNVKDNPRNSICIDGIRYIPIEIVDLAGLVPDAWMGKGLGNKFLDEVRKADALIHVVDISGSTDSEGRIVEIGSYDPLKDVEFIFNEILMWIYKNIQEEIKKDIKKIEKLSPYDNLNYLEKKLSGFSIRKHDINKALNETKLNEKKIVQWKEEEIKKFIEVLIKISKPIVIAANKIDLPISQKNLERLKEKMKNEYIIPTSAEAELALRKASEQGLIEYKEGRIKILKDIDEKRLKALKYIENNVLIPYGSTGVQETLETCIFKVLKYIAVFPVEDINKLADSKGNVLPDVFLVPSTTTCRELAYMIHTEIGEKFLYGINVRNKERVGENYILQHRDVIKIVFSK